MNILNQKEKFETKEIKPEVTPEMIERCKIAFEQYFDLKPKEKILFINDGGTNQKIAELFNKAGSKIPAQFEEIFITKETEEKIFYEKVENADILIRASSHFVSKYPASKNLWQWFESKRNKKTRMLSMADADNNVLNIFKNGGAMTEDLNELKERLSGMETRLKDAAGITMKTSYGTNLKIGLRPYAYSGRQWLKCTGEIEKKPGAWDNWPGGEIYAVPDENKTGGILVLPALSEFNEEEDKFEQGVDKFVYVKIKKGIIVSITGGKSAEKLRKALEKAAAKEKIPWHALQIAEIAFGANSKARPIVQKLEGPYTAKGTPILEAEKRFGTMHIAFGKNRIDPVLRLERFIDAESHLDFVIPRAGLTVEKFDSYEDFEKEKNGRKIINQGSWNFLS